MSMVFTMKSQPGDGLIPGVCAHCEKAVFESLGTLDACYNVWVGKCPHCSAHNFLSMESLRGYSSQGMRLVLPYDEERDKNGLPSDTPTRGPHPSGKAECHGTMLGEIAHQFKSQMKEERPEGERR